MWGVRNPSNIKRSCHNHPNSPETWQKHYKNNHNQMLLAEKKMEEIEGKMKGWEHFQERATLNAILWDFPKGEIILGVCEMSGTPSKKAGSIHKPSPETGQNMTKHVTTKRFLPCLTPPTQGHRNREFFGRTWKEHGRNRVKNEKVGNNSRREPGIMIFWGISPRMIFNVVWCSLGICCVGCSVGWRLHGEKTMHLSQRDTGMCRTNGAKHHHVQLCSA